MKQFDVKKAKKAIIGAIQRCNFYKDFEIDQGGRLIFFTDLFIHSDLSIWDVPEEDEDDEDNEEIVEEVISLSALEQLAEFEKEMDHQASQDETTQQGDTAGN